MLGNCKTDIEMLNELALKKITGIGAEIDLTVVINNLRWAISNLATLGRESKDPGEKDNCLNQIEAITDSISWICTISEISGMMYDARKSEGGLSC